MSNGQHQKFKVLFVRKIYYEQTELLQKFFLDIVKRQNKTIFVLTDLFFYEFYSLLDASC